MSIVDPAGRLVDRSYRKRLGGEFRPSPRNARSWRAPAPWAPRSSVGALGISAQTAIEPDPTTAALRVADGIPATRLL